MNYLEVPVPPFGVCLKAARLAAGIPTAAEAARRLRMEEDFFRDLERDKGTPSWATVYRVIVGLGLDPGFFLPGTLFEGRTR